MRIGTIGAGFVAHAAATVAIRHGHEVMVSNMRGPETLLSLATTLGCKAGSAKSGDTVLVAIQLTN
jgi:predicted dinucleotide-binding enzyme